MHCPGAGQFENFLTASVGRRIAVAVSVKITQTNPQWAAGPADVNDVLSLNRIGDRDDIDATAALRNRPPPLDGTSRCHSDTLEKPLWRNRRRHRSLKLPSTGVVYSDCASQPAPL